MATGTLLPVLRQMLKAEIGDEMDETITSSNDLRYNRQLENMQIWLVGEHAWLLPPKVRKEVALTAGTRLYDLPTGIDLQALAYPAYVKLDRWRFYLDFGISQADYNALSPDVADGQFCDPVFRWDVAQDGAASKLEVWPIPASDQTLIFEGRPTLGALAAPTDAAVVDDLVLVLFTAASILSTRKGGAAQACLARAQSRLNRLRGERPSQFETFSMRGGGRARCTKERPMVGVTDFSVSYIRFVNGGTQIKGEDGLWYDFRLVVDQGQTTLEIGQTGSQ